MELTGTNTCPQLYLTKPDYDERCLERMLWEDRERVNSEEAYRKIYQSNSGALVSGLSRAHPSSSSSILHTDPVTLVFCPMREPERDVAPAP